MKFSAYQPTLSLKPTQFSIGMLEVEFKVLEFKKLRAKKLARLIRKTPVPVVVSLWQELCIVDHHHFLFACWHADIRSVKIDIIKDYSKSSLSYHRFWRRMVRQQYAYPYDQFGNGPRSPLYLPLDIRGCADDPYRSLAWMVRKEGGYENSEQSFAEFAWADFFRGKRLLDTQGRRGFHAAVGRGLRLAKSRSASGLPGFCRSTKSVKLAEKEILTKSRYVPKEQKKGPLATRVKAAN
ncbi:MAG: ParB/Srx family N-terminal domain-containing protein [Burkholderiales bacterium]